MQGIALQIQSVVTGSGMVGQSYRRLLTVAPLNFTDPNTGIAILNQGIYSFKGGYQILAPPNINEVPPGDCQLNISLGIPCTEPCR